MTREQKIAKARELREAGLVYADIAKALGVTHSCVQKWLKPDRAREYTQRENSKPEANTRKRAWDNAHRASCPRCGQLMCAGSTDNTKPERCKECQLEDIREQGRQTYRRLEALWLAGKTYPEIQEAFGWSKGRLSNALTRGRALGYNLPHRYASSRRSKAYEARWSVAA
jgi:predicted transcriptional regulator